MTQMNPIRVMVLADSPHVRASLQGIVDANPLFELAGGASASDIDTDGLEGPAPDVLLIDLEPWANDAPGAGRSVAGHSPPALVLLTDEADGDWLQEALRGDAAAILTRDAPPAEIAAAIEAVAAGLVALSRDMLARLLPDPKAARQAASAAPVEALTAREIEVLAMLAEGLGNKEIARHLDISDNTVKFHLSSIFGKLGATSRTEAVMLGMRHGLIMI